MAYMNQETKSKIAPWVRKALQKYGIKGTLAVRNHSTLVLNIKSGKIDFIQNYNEAVGQRPGAFRNGSPATDYLSVNPYWYHEHFTGRAKAFLTDIMAAMNNGNHNNSDASIDYFDVGWYVDVNIGRWNKPYILEK